MRDMKNQKEKAFDKWSELCNDEEERRKLVNTDWKEAIDSENELDKKPKHIPNKNEEDINSVHSNSAQASVVVEDKSNLDVSLGEVSISDDSSEDSLLENKVVLNSKSKKNTELVDLTTPKKDVATDTDFSKVADDSQFKENEDDKEQIAGMNLDTIMVSNSEDAGELNKFIDNLKDKETDVSQDNVKEIVNVSDKTNHGGDNIMQL